MPTEALIVRVFVSSPKDVQRERASLDGVVAEINRSLRSHQDVRLELLVWDRNVVPGMGRPQDLVNKQIGPYDIFLGIMWKRFGTPTGVADSGTEEEFNHAYQIWQQHGVLHILFYFCQTPYRIDSSEDLGQLSKVLAFRKQIETKGLVIDYESADVFPNVVRPHLFNIIHDIVAAHRGPVADPPRVSPLEPEPFLPDDAFTTLPPDDYGEMRVPGLDGVFSSFRSHGTASRFLRIKVDTTPGYVLGEWRHGCVFIIRDPVRPYLVQIGETRSLRNAGNPEVVPELTHLSLDALLEMYPFISGSSFKWIRMVIAELSTRQEVLDHIYRHDPDQHVRKIAARNPSGSVALMSKECPFCDPRFHDDRRLGERLAESQHTLVIRNDFPYGPYFHYIAMPRAPIHSWEDLTEPQLSDLNHLIWRFLRNKLADRTPGLPTGRRIHGAPGVHVGFNSTVRHLVLTRHSRASAGASIAHVHKQVWGMSEGSAHLASYLSSLCSAHAALGIDYLGDYLEALERKGFVLWDDEHVALYVPIGQISVHELQVMVKRSGVHTYVDLTEGEVKSISRAEFIAAQVFKGIGITSFNQVLLTENLAADTRYFRLIIAFVTREVDLAVSELNHLYVVDKHPMDTVNAILNAKDVEEKARFTRHRHFGVR